MCSRFNLSNFDRCLKLIAIGCVKPCGFPDTGPTTCAALHGAHYGGTVHLANKSKRPGNDGSKIVNPLCRHRGPIGPIPKWPAQLACCYRSKVLSVLIHSKISWTNSLGIEYAQGSSLDSHSTMQNSQEITLGPMERLTVPCNTVVCSTNRWSSKADFNAARHMVAIGKTRLCPYGSAWTV